MKCVLLFCGAALCLTACERNSPAAKAQASAPQVYAGRGVVKELEPDGRTVVVQHEAISNYMAAMTMPFEAHDTNQLRGLHPGDAIKFNLYVTPTDGWIGDITRETTNGLPVSTATAASPWIQVSKAVEPLDEGDLLPEYHFTNELGQPVHLSQFKGGVLAFTFFFTSCPFPNFCPRLTGNFEAVSAQLARMTNAPARWHLLSISFDPKTDTPARLLAYAKMAKYDPAHWSFLTGAPDQIGELADQFEEKFWTENGSISHNLRTVVVDARGRIRKIYQGNGWSPADLVQEMVKAAGK